MEMKEEGSAYQQQEAPSLDEGSIFGIPRLENGK